MAEQHGSSGSENAYLQQLSLEALYQLLAAGSCLPEEQQDDAFYQAVEEAILQKEKEGPSGKLPEVEASWIAFQQQYHLPEFEGARLYDACHGKDPGSPRKTKAAVILRRAVIAAAVMAAFFGAMIAVQAAGIDVFGTIARWTADTFHFERADQDPQYLPVDEGLQNALSEIGASAALVPKWYPDGYEICQMQTLEQVGLDVVEYVLSDGDNRQIIVSIVHFYDENSLLNQDFEKNNTLVEAYLSRDRTFYLFSNMETLTATWSDGVYCISINGKLTNDEMKAIIDSI